MNKSDRIIVGVLVALLIGWVFYNKQATEKYYREHPELLAQNTTNNVPAEVATATATDVATADVSASAVAEVVPDIASTTESLPEEFITIENSVAQFTFTTKGGGLKSASLTKYDKSINRDGCVEFEFADVPTLSLQGIDGVAASADFKIVQEQSNMVSFAASAGALKLERQISVGDGYLMHIKDTFRNTSATALTLPGYSIALGAMPSSSATPDTRFGDFGVDLHTDASSGKETTLEQSLTASFSKSSASLAGMFGVSGGGCSAATVSPYAPLEGRSKYTAPTKWLSVRDRFFAQIITPRTMVAEGVVTTARRAASTIDAPLALECVGASLAFEGANIAPGGSVQMEYDLYVGPRKLSELNSMGSSYRDILHFGMWSWFCRVLLTTLNVIHSVIPNYGWAIIILTAIVRLILFPLNKRSTESMRKMSEIQPKIKELQEKYKSDPRKLQAEQMRVYAEAHVNPLASCLPMLIQLPIFIALFTVLRSCVELRFESFLWIKDLSEPENLFKNTLGFGVNLLPILMAVTMTLQSRLTPSTGDASQQKMMTVMMPVMMLVMCYNFASALGLYWTVSQAMAIFALWRSRRKGAMKSAAAGTVVEVIPPPRETRQMRRSKSDR